MSKVANTSPPASTADDTTNRTVRLMVTQSGFYRTALRLGNIPIVLPFVIAELDADLWIAAPIFPAFTAGGAIGNVLAPAALAAVPRRRQFLAIVSCLTALAGVNACCATVGTAHAAGISFV